MVSLRCPFYLFIAILSLTSDKDSTKWPLVTHDNWTIVHLLWYYNL